MLRLYIVGHNFIDELGQITTSSEKIDDSSSVNNKLNKLLSIVRKHLGMEVAFISQFINNTRVFKTVDAKDNISPININDSDPINETYCAKIVDNELPNIIHDTKYNKITSKLAITDKLSIGSYIGVPIKLSTGETYGTICCFKYSADDTLNLRDLSFFKAIADIAAELIETKHLIELNYNEVRMRIISVIESNEIEIYYQPIIDRLN